jgi:superfamily II DNA or RNA helicase
MANIDIQYYNDVHIRLKCEEQHITQELSDYFCFEVPGAKFTPAFRHKMWDGKIRLFNYSSGLIYAGLLPYILEYCKDRNLTVSINPECVKYLNDIERSDIESFCQTLNIHSKGKKIEPYPYQIDGIHHALSASRTLLLSPTGSGKSLVMYCLARYMPGRTLIVVPSTSLVEQLYGDFADYSSEVRWTTEKNVHKIYSGKDKDSDCPITITTWQSIFTLPKSWFSQFQNVIVDECHTVKADSLKKILEKMVRTRYRIGLTGTLDGTKTHKLVIEGLLGKVFRMAMTKDLMNSGLLSPIKIESILLKYNDSVRKESKSDTYQEEIDRIVSNDTRNDFIAQLALRTKGNTLILFTYVDRHGKVLHEKLQKLTENTNRKVFFIWGNVDAEERNQMREIVEKESDAIIVGSYGCMAVGINIKNLHNIIFASPSKSRIRILQSIGRQLRVSSSKLVAKLYDIGDDLSWKSRKNHTLLHWLERIKLYTEEKFEYRVSTLKI